MAGGPSCGARTRAGAPPGQRGSHPAWAAEPAADERKLMGFKWLSGLSIMFFFTWYYKRVRWSPVKNRRLELY